MVLAPQARNDLAPGDHLAGTARQQLQQRVLLGAQSQQNATAFDLAAGKIDFEIAEGHPARSCRRAAARDGGQPRHELVHGERLDQVVVAAGGEPVEPILDQIPRRQKEHRGGQAPFPPEPQEVEGVSVRQHPVENDDVIAIRADEGLGVAAVHRFVNAVAVRPETAGDGFPHLALVLDDKNSHPFRVSRYGEEFGRRLHPFARDVTKRASIESHLLSIAPALPFMTPTAQAHGGPVCQNPREGKTMPTTLNATGAQEVSVSPCAPEDLSARYREVRDWTATLCEPLVTEDYVVQSMPDASPIKWHLAHTTWFFEALILKPHLNGYTTPDPQYNYFFNSYYNTIGKQWTRSERGLLSRPTVDEVQSFREFVDHEMARFFDQASPETLAEVTPVLEIGLNHEQQHQELMVTDLKHMLSRNPLDPVYREIPPVQADTVPSQGWRSYDEGLRWIGDDGGQGFAYDNETPRHRVFCESFAIADRLVTCGEYLEFMADGGYEKATLWLSDGWATVQAEGWNAPLYWQREEDGSWSQFTLAGRRPVCPEEPICHVSLFEADAFARWAGARLPTEAEWEVAADDVLGVRSARGDTAPAANFVEDGLYHPRPWQAAAAQHGQFFGDVWEWTRSPYSAYPGYQVPEGPLGEYNSKFMNAQLVLRGGSCATPRSHIRSTYRNFFPPMVRWQFMGFRLARDGGTQS